MSQSREQHCQRCADWYGHFLDKTNDSLQLHLMWQHLKVAAWRSFDQSQEVRTHHHTSGPWHGDDRHLLPLTESERWGLSSERWKRWQMSSASYWFPQSRPRPKFSSIAHPQLGVDDGAARFRGHVWGSFATLPYWYWCQRWAATRTHLVAGIPQWQTGLDQLEGILRSCPSRENDDPLLQLAIWQQHGWRKHPPRA